MLCYVLHTYHNLFATSYTRFSFLGHFRWKKGNETLITNSTSRKWTDYDWIVDWRFNLYFNHTFSMKFFIFSSIFACFTSKFQYFCRKFRHFFSKLVDYKKYISREWERLCYFSSNCSIYTNFHFFFLILSTNSTW